MHVSASRTVTPQGTASAIAGLAVTPPQRAPPQPPPAQFSSAQPSRMAPSLEEISALPKLKLTKPPRSCEDELRRPELGAVVAGMDVLLSDVGFKVQQLKFDPLPVALPEDELFAVAAYTYDDQVRGLGLRFER